MYFILKSKEIKSVYFLGVGNGKARSATTMPRTSNGSTLATNEEMRSNLLTPDQLVKLISGILDENLVQKISGTFQFNILGQSGGTWYVDLKNGSGKISTDAPAESPDVVLSMSVEEFQRILYGQATAFDAYMQGTLKVDGDLRMAMNLETLVKKIKQGSVTDEKEGSHIPGVYVV